MKVKEEEKKVFMPVKDYAEKHGITVQTVYNKIKAGTIESKKIGSYNLVRG